MRVDTTFLPGRICIVDDGRWFGWPVRLIAPAPVGVAFQLPTGLTQDPVGPGHWVCESLAGPAPTSTGQKLCIGTIRVNQLIPLIDGINVI